MEVINQQTIVGLRELSQKIKKDLISELIDLYLGSTPEMIKNMRSLIQSDCLDDLGREAHSLKSSSANIGADRIAEKCRLIETAVFNGNQTDIQFFTQLIDDISEEYALIQVELQKIKIQTSGR